MKRVNSFFNRHRLITLMLLLMLLLAGCSSSDSTPGLVNNNPNNPGDPINPDPGNPGTAAVTITGTVIGEKAPVTAGAAASITARITSLLPASIAALLPAAAADIVPLAVPTAVVLVDETGKTKSQIVTDANGAFAITVPTEHSYVLVFREENETGKTLGALTVNGAGRVAFSLPKTSTPVLYLGAVTIDPDTFKASCANDVSTLPPPATVLPDTEGFGFPDIAGVLKSNKIPTDGAPSPLFGAGEFEQQMIVFEEFGTEPMPAGAANGFAPLPQPVVPSWVLIRSNWKAFLHKSGSIHFRNASPTPIFSIPGRRPLRHFWAACSWRLQQQWELRDLSKDGREENGGLIRNGMKCIPRFIIKRLRQAPA